MDFYIRAMVNSDLSGVLDALASLDPTLAEVSTSSLKSAVSRRSALGWTLSTFVAVNKADNSILGTATLFIEPKLIHAGAFAGHIEDVAVLKSCQGAGIGKALIVHCVEVAKTRQCYKVILDCSRENLEFYEKCGFEIDNFGMRLDISVPQAKE